MRAEYDHSGFGTYWLGLTQNTESWATDKSQTPSNQHCKNLIIFLEFEFANKLVL